MATVGGSAPALAWASTTRGSTELPQSVAQTIRYMQHASCIPDDRVFNIDETSTRMLPVDDQGWGKMKSACRAVGDSRVQCTMTLSTPVAHGEMCARILYVGLTGKALPMGPQPRGILVGHTHTHWQTV